MILNFLFLFFRRFRRSSRRGVPFSSFEIHGIRHVSADAYIIIIIIFWYSGWPKSSSARPIQKIDRKKFLKKMKNITILKSELIDKNDGQYRKQSRLHYSLQFTS